MVPKVLKTASDLQTNTSTMIHKTGNLPDRFKNFFSSITTNKAVLIIFTIGIFVYANSLFNGFVGDDTKLIVSNPRVHSISNIPKLFESGVFYDPGTDQANYYRPIVSVTSSLIYTVFGENPFPYHLLQLSFHISNTIFIFLIFKTFLKNKIALLFSLIFLVHPINVETVANIASLQDVQFLFFGLLALYLSIRDKGHFSTRIFLIQTLLLTLAVLSKETAVLFIILIPIFNILFRKRILLHALQGAFVIAIYSFLRFGLAEIFFNKTTIVPIMTMSFGERLITIPKIIISYLETFIYPKNLASLQGWTVTSINFQDFYLPLILCIAVLILFVVFSVFIFKNNKTLFKILLFFYVWFAIGLGIHLQVIPLDQTVANRWFYFPIVGLLGIMGVAVKYYLPREVPKYLYIIAISILLLLSSRTIVRNTDWKDNFTLCNHDIQINQNSHQLEGCIGYELFLRKDFDKAETHFINAVKLFPNDDTWANLGNYYFFTKKLNDAEQSYTTALRYGNSPKAYLGLVRISLSTSNFKLAERYTKQALEKYPNYADMLGYLAYVKYKLGDKNEAVSLANKAYTLTNDPKYWTLWNYILYDKNFTLQ